MSWEDMVNNNLIAAGTVSKAAIIGLDGSLWAKSSNFNPSGDELIAATKAFTDPGSALASGLHFEGQKYFVLQADDERVIGKKSADGFFLYKTNQTVVIGLYEGGIAPGACSVTTAHLSDYLKSTGY
ncbi:Profilin [Aphelenchoides bicaudatus]|nr:Profilin [Aphelenchoides bicaudatus]